jgi:hypothetical protein
MIQKLYYLLSDGTMSELNFDSGVDASSNDMTPPTFAPAPILDIQPSLMVPPTDVNTVGASATAFNSAATQSSTGNSQTTVINGFAITSIDYPGILHVWSAGINDAGQIVGYYFTNNSPLLISGFLYSGGTFTPFNPASSVATYPTAINSAGQIVGYYQSRHGIQVNVS